MRIFCRPNNRPLRTRHNGLQSDPMRSHLLYPWACVSVQPQYLIGEFRAALDACLSALQQPQLPQQQVEWYSHGIPVDNLNVYRVNWPTA